MSKAKEKPRNFLKSVTCFNKILRLFGLGFFPPAQVNLCNRIGFLLNLSCSVFVLAIALHNDRSEPSMKSTIVREGWHNLYQLEAILVLPLMIFNYIKRKHVQGFVAKVREFDELVADVDWMKIKPKHSQRCHFVCMCLVVSSILVLLLYCLTSFVRFTSQPGFDQALLQFIQCMSFFYVTEFYLLISFQFMFGTIFGIYRRFEVLNENVR
jgi:hypothetical protein